MEAMLESPQERQQNNYCRLCGRPPWGALLGDCAVCTNIFELKKGRHLYSPLTGRRWLKSVGNATLVNVNHAHNRTVDVPSDNLSKQSPSFFWWGLLAVAGAFLSGFIRFVFRNK
ncbi:MAG TPA: hypothetical protein PKN33_03970 [Phycisphaerae bacterium]|nr:hypothetical protein [Phycisphaerae bacterium]